MEENEQGDATTENGDDGEKRESSDEHVGDEDDEDDDEEEEASAVTTGIGYSMVLRLCETPPASRGKSRNLGATI